MYSSLDMIAAFTEIFVVCFDGHSMKFLSH